MAGEKEGDLEKTVKEEEKALDKKNEKPTPEPPADEKNKEK